MKMKTSASLTPERISVATGLCIVMLSTLPRYRAGGNETHQTLLIFVTVALVVYIVIQWRLLSVTSRQRMPGLLRRLVLSLLAGLAGMTAWHTAFSDWFSWQLLLSHGTTLGLILHALSFLRNPTSSV